MVKKVRTSGFILFSAFLVLILTAATVTRNSVFRDNVSFWADATEKSPGKQRTHHNYGCALAEAEQHAAALQEFRKTLAIKPDGSVLLGFLLIEMGNSYYNLEEYDNAISIWQEALRRGPDSAELLNNLAMGFLKKKRYTDARNYAERSLTIDPTMADTLSTLGQIHLAMGNSEAAIHWSLLALQKKPEAVSLYWDAIEVLEKTGCFALAEEYARRVAKLEQDDRSRQRARKYMESIKEMKVGIGYFDNPVCPSGKNGDSD